MYDTPQIFGHESHLVGLLSWPDSATPAPVSVLFLNAGLEHRVGPRGLNTAFARALAAAGWPSLRFDYAGTGESRKPGRPLATERRDELIAECDAAIDRLIEETGCRQVVLVGLCSGADDAHRIAMADTRVAGMVQIDGHAATTPGFVWRYYAQRVFSARRWANIARRLGSAKDSTPRAAIDDVDFFTMPDRDTLATDLATLVARDVKLFYVYSGAAQNYYNHAGQLRSALASVDFADALVERHRPSADHTFSVHDERVMLFDAVIDWLGHHWPGDTPHG